MNWLSQRLQALLRERRLSIQKVASDLGIERAYLSLIVHGRRVPSEDLVHQLANYFKEDEEEWSFQVKARPVIEGFEEKYPNMMPQYARQMHERQEKKKPPYPLGPTTYRGFFTSEATRPSKTGEFIPLDRIELYATETLRVFAQILGCDLVFPLDAELLVREVFNLDVHYDGDGLLDRIHHSLLGCLFADGSPCPELGIDRLVVVNGASRYQHVTPAFTILHEAGHYVFHYPKDAMAERQESSYCRSEHIGEQKTVKVPPREWQASRYASEVLMPKDKVIWILDGKPPGEVINLAIYGPIFREYFGVSQGAMEKRLHDMGYQCGFGRYAYANITETSSRIGRGNK